MNTHRKLLAAAVAVAMSGSALASTVGSTGAAGSGAVVAYAGALTIAAEALQDTAYVLDLDPAVASPLGTAGIGATIRFVPSFGLNSGDILTFSFGGALYMGADVKLVAEEAVQFVGATDVDGNAATTDVIEVASNFGALDPVNGVSAVQVRINNSVILPTGIELVLQVDGSGLEVAGDGALDDASANPTITIPAGTAPGNITVSSTGITSGGSNIPAAGSTNDGIIADVETQIALTVAPATSVIDVAAVLGARQSFVEEAGAGGVLTSIIAVDDTDLQASSGNWTVSNDGDGTVEDFFVLDGGDTLDVTLQSSSNLDGIDTLAGTNFIEHPLTPTGAVDTADTIFTLVPASNNMTAALIGTEIPVAGAMGTDDIVVGTDGVTTLEDRTFALSATLTMDGDFAGTSGSVYVFPGGTSHTWTTNGTVLHATYVNTNPAFNNRYVLTNTGGTAAPYTATCQVEAGNTCTLGPAAAGIIPANGNLTLNGTDVIMSVQGTGNVNRAAATFTIEAPTTVTQGSSQVIESGVGVITDSPMLRIGTN